MRDRARIVLTGAFLAAIAVGPAASSAPPKPQPTKPAKPQPTKPAKPVDPLQEEIKKLSKEAAELVDPTQLMNDRDRVFPKEKLDAAIKIYERVVALEEKSSGKDSKDVARRLQHLANLLRKNREYSRELEVRERNLTIAEKISGPEGFDTRYAVQDVAQAASRAKQHARAIAMYERYQALIEKKAGAESHAAAGALWEMSGVLRAAGDAPHALAALERAIQILEKNPTDGVFSKCINCQSEIALVLGWMADIHIEKGAYLKAEPLLARALTIALKVRNPDYDFPTRAFKDSARLAELLGDYSRAAELLQQAIDIKTADAGASSPGVALLSVQLGHIQSERGDLAGAETMLVEAIRILGQDQLPDDPGLIPSKTYLGVVYTRKGDLGRAEPHLRAVLATSEKTKGPDSMVTAEVVAALADLYRRKGDLAQAEAHASRSLDITERAMGADHPQTIAARLLLAELREARGDAKAAQALYEKALAAREKALGPEHPDTARALLSLADLHRRAARAEQADPLYQRALAIAEKSLGEDHPVVASILEGMAALRAAGGNVVDAIPLQTRASDILDHNVELILGSGSEAQKRDRMAALGASTDFTVSLHLTLAPKNKAAERLALGVILQRKGRILDVMADALAKARRRAGPAEKESLDALAAARARYSSAAIRGPTSADVEGHRREVDALRKQVETLEERLGDHGSKILDQETPATIERVQAAMPEDSVLVELLVYRPRGSKDNAAAASWAAPRYGAYILTPSGKIDSFDLGEAALIADAAGALRRAIESRGAKDEKSAARAVDEMVMRPLRGALGSATKILISPDGVLHTIPFAALIDEKGQRLVERYQFTYLTSGRDLLRLQFHQNERSAPLIVANPAFGRAASQSALDAASPDRSASLGGAIFPQLPGTAGEARALSALLPEASLKVDTQATEAALKDAKAPRILHIATHGFFLANRPVMSSEGRGLALDPGITESPSEALAENPLVRSGLALAGANGRKSGDDDGILTALETTGLDLDGTKLVVLSACETGLGEVQNGDGVLGLRRAFLLAGAETQMVSLWKVADRETRDLMVGYYEKLKKGGGRSQSLRDVQLAMLARPETADPYFWAAFLVSGDPSPLPPPAPVASAGGAAPARPATAPPRVMAPPGCACDIGARETSSAAGLIGAVALLFASLWRKFARA